MFKPPKTPQRTVQDDLHGVKLTDHYQWLEDKQAPEVVDWTRGQHEATLEFLKSLPEIAGLKDDISAFLDREIVGPVFLKADRQFFYMKAKGEQQFKLYTRIDDRDKLVFDPHPLDEEGKASISEVSFTVDANKVAVGVQFKGDEISDYYIIDTRTAAEVAPKVQGLRGFNWCKDGERAYVFKGTREMLEKQIPIRTYLHKLGDDPENDIFLLAPKDAKDIVNVVDSAYSDRTFFYEGDFYSNKVGIRKVGTLDEPEIIYDSKQFRSYVQAIDDELYIFTNHEAPNFKLMHTKKDAPGFENWQPLIPEKETVLEGYEVTKTHLIIQDKKDVLSRLLLHDLKGNFQREIPLPELGSVSGMNYHRDSDTLFVTLATFGAPARVYKLDLDTLEWELFFEREAPIDTSQIESKIVFYRSKDGTKVPMFLHRRRDAEDNGENPTLLYGYGGFNIGIKPAYIGMIAAFINRGGVFAHAGIRGGNEYGEAWHNDGMLDKKQNCFDDFIAAAEYLIEEKITNSDRLAIKGGSNGGLLMGAMLTQRPELFKAVICGVPLLDMIRYHKFLIARYWIPEYGDPDKPEEFKTLLQYSPYHNISEQKNYPTLFCKAGENDTRVDPLHAKKFVAALQNNPEQENPVLLYMDYDSGHGSGKSTEQQIEDLELEYRWLMNQIM